MHTENYFKFPKKIELDGIVYALNEKEKEAYIIDNCISDSFYLTFCIPRSIIHKSQEFVVKRILEGSFENSRFYSIKFASDSELQIIGKDSFYRSYIQSITIPSQVTEICENAFFFCFYLQKVEFESDSKIQKIGKNAFSSTKIESIIIPDTVIQISEDAFDSCDRLEKVIFSENSELQIIGRSAFSNTLIEDFFVPRHVTRICKRTFKNCKRLQSIEFPEDSEIQTIEKDAFFESSIQKIIFPPSLCELKEGWCNETNYLTDVEIMKNNQYFMNYKNSEMVIGKSDIAKNEFDVLVFVSRNIEKVTIPSFIKIFGSYSLSSISIDEVQIPDHITQICEGTFSKCVNLSKIEFTENSELQIIDKNAFYNTKIEHILITEKVSQLNEGWCAGTSDLKKVTVMPKNQNFINFDSQMILGKTSTESEVYDKIIFVNRDIKKVTIPSFIRIIDSYSFSYSTIENVLIPENVIQINDATFSFCKKLKKVEIPQNSKLQKIGKYAFYNSTIDSIFIPSNVTKISKYCFKNCYCLQKVEIPQNSRIQKIEKSAFNGVSIKKIFIPSFVKVIGEDAFSFSFYLRHVEIPKNSQLQKIEKSAFMNASFDSLFIPSSVTDIDEFGFYTCEKLSRILIPHDSKLKSLESEIFAKSLIDRIFIPPEVTKICVDAFALCRNLKYVEIPYNSKLQLIDEFAFASTKITALFFPRFLAKVHKKAFDCCMFLQIIEISDNPSLWSIDLNLVWCNNLAIMIPKKTREKKG